MQLQNNRKRFGILVIVLGIVLIGVIAYFTFFYDFNKTESSNIVEKPVEKKLPKSKINIVAPKKTTTTMKPVPFSTKTELFQEDVRQLANSFAERIGSWSNQANSSNLIDLKLFMTKEMQDWVDDSIVKNRFKKDYEQYYGITTKAVTANVISKDDNYAKVMVSTKRTENKDNQTKIFNQDILIKLTKPGKAWKVDGAYWQ